MKRIKRWGILGAAVLISTACSAREEGIIAQSTVEPAVFEAASEGADADSSATVKAETTVAATEAADDFIHPEVFTVNVDINGHPYEYDAVSSATKEIRDENPPAPMDYEEKIAAMFWSAKPAEGFISGDYYVAEKIFEEHESKTTPGTQTAYTAILRVVKDGEQLAMVELDEIGPDDYYAGEWSGKSKRSSGYAFFQAENQRTEKTMVTWVNGQTYLEHQMVSENRLTGDFNTVKGTSNSARKAFIPAAAELAEIIKTNPSKQKYYALTKDFENGITARLELIYEGTQLIDLNYNEFYADTEEEIEPEEEKQFYRQSKYYSRTYKDVTGKDFVAFVDHVKSQGLSAQTFTQIESSYEPGEFESEFNHLLNLLNDIEELVPELKGN